MSGSSARSDRQKTEEEVDHRQNNYVKAMWISPERSNLGTPLIAVSAAVRSSHNDSVRSTTVEAQLKQRVVQLSEYSSPPSS